MSDHNYTTTFTVDASPAAAFDAIIDPRRWWSRAIEGDTRRPGAVFFYHYKDVHRCTIKITDVVPGKKVVWHVLHNAFDFVKDATEWTGTDVVFEISRKGSETEVRFTHVGLVPDYECYDVCTDRWGFYINGSLRSLITTEQGQPNPVEEIVSIS